MHLLAIRDRKMESFPGRCLPRGAGFCIPKQNGKAPAPPEKLWLSVAELASLKRLRSAKSQSDHATFQACRRSCATYLQRSGNVKDIQAHLRHAEASTTLGIYVQEIPESVRAAVESLDRLLTDRWPVHSGGSESCSEFIG